MPKSTKNKNDKSSKKVTNKKVDSKKAPTKKVVNNKVDSKKIPAKKVVKKTNNVPSRNKKQTNVVETAEKKYSFDEEYKNVSKKKEETPTKIKYSFDDEYNELLKNKKKVKKPEIKYSFDDEYKELIKKKKKEKPQEIKYSFEQEPNLKKEEIEELEVQEEQEIPEIISTPEELLKQISSNKINSEETRLSRRRRASRVSDYENERETSNYDADLINLFKKKEEPKEETKKTLEDIITQINEPEENIPSVETSKTEDDNVVVEHDYIKEVTEVEYTPKKDNEFEDLVGRFDYKGKDTEEPKISQEEKKPRKLKKWVYAVILLLLIGSGLLIYKIINDKKENERLLKEEELLAEINSHYGEYVKTKDQTKLYKLDSNEYVEIGTVYKDVNLELEKVDISLDTKYFKVKDTDYYVAYENLEKSIEEKKDTRYKSYLVFNSNVVTKDNFTLYQDDKEMYSFNKSMEFPIIINNYENKYYVEYNNMLLNIKKDDVLKTVDAKNTEKKNQSKITTLCYHGVYDTDTKCTDPYICIKKASFDQEMKYLSDNNYLTLTLEELYMYLKGNLRVEKATVITFDDGYKFKSADEVLDKYKLNGTMFVISGDFKDYSQFENLKAIQIQSHTHKLHQNYVCSGGSQGGAILCAGKDKIVEDLKTSLAALKVEPIGLAFPFYDYNETAIAAVKEAGFKMAFVGRAGKLGKSTPKETDLYKIPRMTVYEQSLMSFNEWKGYL